MEMGNTTENAHKNPNKTQTDNRTREAKAKTCFCQRRSRDSASRSGRKTREEATGGRTVATMLEQPLPSGPDPPRLTAGLPAGWAVGARDARVAVAGFLPLHMPWLFHKTESLRKGKHLIMGSPGEGWIQRTCSSAFLNQGWALVVSKSQVFSCLCWEGKPQISPKQASWSVYRDGSSELEHSSQAPRAEDGA